MRAVRLTAIAMVAALVWPGAADAGPRKPARIMSTNVCTDLLVLQLAPKSRISSVTYLAHDAIGAVAPGLDAGVAINHGSAEEVLREKPDLLLTGDVSTPMMRRLARKVGAPLIEVKSAVGFDDIRAITRQVGAAVGEPARAEALVAEMDRTLARLAATAPPKPFVLAAWSGDYVPGRKTLANAIIEAAGAVNVAALLPNDRDNAFGVEDILRVRPEILMSGADGASRPSLKTAAISHRVIRRLYRDRQITYAEPLYTCGVPQSATAAAALREALVARTGRGR
jgi:iron complex transport system substrate-binding protein